MTTPAAPGPRNGILSLTIKDKSVLYAAYMPFVKHDAVRFYSKGGMALVAFLVATRIE